MKFVARVAFHPSPQFEGDIIRCAPTHEGLLPYVIRELVEWGVQVKLVKGWQKP